MRKFLAFFSLLFFIAFYSTAQTVVPNAGLEDWHTVGTFEDPDGWQTSNDGSSLAGIIGVTKDTDAVDGQFAARMETKKITFPITVVVPGAMATGVIDIINQTFLKGFPLTDPNPVAMIGYYKYSSVGGDSCLAFAALTHWDTGNGKRDTVAVAFFKAGGTTTTYTQFIAPFFYLLPGTTPDSAIVLAVTAVDYLAAHEGSVMFVDDIDFTNAVGQYEIPEIPLNVFPNPADKSVRVSIPEGINANEIVITGTDGRIFREIMISNSTTIDISTGDFTDGTYLLYAKDVAGKIVASGKFIVGH